MPGVLCAYDAALRLTFNDEDRKALTATAPRGELFMPGLSDVITISAVALATLIALVIAAFVLNWFVHKEQPASVVATQPSVIDAAWLPKEEAAKVPPEKLAALYAAAQRNTPESPDSSRFPVLMATMGM